MEINLSAVWRKIKIPFIWLYEQVNLVYETAEAKLSKTRVGKKISKKRAKSRFGKRKKGKFSAAEKRLRMIKMMRWSAIGALVFVVLGVVSFFVLFAYFSRDLPKPGQVVRREGFSTKIYDRNEQLLYDLFDTERRNPVKYEEIPQDLINATVAVEDKDFWTHIGYDKLTILRIPYNIIFRKRVVGGSTLTQQLVKNALLTNERSISRKFKELVLAIQIERTFTKEEILEMYLNEAPYGGTAWGVGTAAEIYFNKPVSELTLTESVILAGLPQRPSAYSPYNGKTTDDGELLWKFRARGVLRRMREDDYITGLAYEEAVASLEEVEFEKQAIEIKAPHFVFYVKDELTEMFGEELVEKGGLKVTTTLDLDLHNEAQEIVKEEVEDVAKYDITNGAAMVMNPQTGEVLSMVGSKDFFDTETDGQFNVAVDALRQPGSSIKPVTYLALLQMGYTPASILVDVPTTFAPNDSAKVYEPKSYDGKFRGPVSVRNSLGSSLNIPAVKALAYVGVENFLDLAYRMGFDTFEPSQENLRRFGLAITLGGGEVHLIDTMSSYSSFANGGKKVEPIAVLKVEDSEGRVLYEHKQVEGERVFTEEGAFLINNILSDNNARLLAFGSNSLLNVSPNVAVKTGTTNLMKDNWTIGWSQEVIVGTWVGNNDNTSMKYVASGITGASPIWRRIIVSAFEEHDFNAPDWVVPAGIEQTEVDKISGYYKHDDFESRMEYLIKGTLLAPPDPIHTKLKLCKGENKLANEARIASGDYDTKEFIILREEDPFSQDGKNRWQDAINLWIEAQEDGRYKYPTEYCGTSEDVFVKMSRPENEKTYDNEDIEIHIDANSDQGIEKIELWVDGSLRETIHDRSYRGKVHLSKGQHELYAKAKSRGGKEAESNKVKIGTGGESWEKPEATPTPTPTLLATSPTPGPTVTPTVTPEATPTTEP